MLVAGSSAWDSGSEEVAGDCVNAGVLIRLVSWLPDFGGGTGGVWEYILHFLRFRSR